MGVAVSTGYRHHKFGVVQEIDQATMRARVFWFAMKNRTYVKIQRLTAYSGIDEKGGQQ